MASSLIVVIGSGRGCTLRSDLPVAGAWIALRGRLQLGSGQNDTVVPGELRITEIEANVQAIGRGNAVWAAVLGTSAAWRQLVELQCDIPVPEPALLPARHVADRELRRLTIALARAPDDEQREVALEALIERFFMLQNHLAESIERCPGRTYAQRRQVFLRLQRVRNYLAANCHLELDNEALARMASYSPWHFIRAFRAAYRQTPHAYLVDRRLQRARRLLCSSPLAIAEIALASGFENRCAFSRLFRERFGMTAGSLRRQSLDIAAH